MKQVLSWLAKVSGVAIASGLMLGVSAVHAADVPQGPAKPDVKAGALLYQQGDAARGIVACASCHGEAGNSTLPVNPNLSAQPHEYIYKQLVDFRAGADGAPAKRQGANGAPSVMTPMVTSLTEADMRNVALYLAEQPLTKPATAGHESLMAQGEKIWRGGIAAKNVPACAACHLANGAGIPAQYPRLGGQYASYVEEQLKNFRAGHRTNSPMMVQIANRMSDEEIKAVSDYAAGLR